MGIILISSISFFITNQLFLVLEISTGGAVFKPFNVPCIMLTKRVPWKNTAAEAKWLKLLHSHNASETNSHIHMYIALSGSSISHRKQIPIHRKCSANPKIIFPWHSQNQIPEIKWTLHCTSSERYFYSMRMDVSTAELLMDWPCRSIWVGMGTLCFLWSSPSIQMAQKKHTESCIFGE